MNGTVSSGYGMRKDPKAKSKTENHKGIDVPIKPGTAVHATANGTVFRAGWQNKKDHSVGFGNSVVLSNGNGNTSNYGHMSKLSVKTGDKVRRGQVIGYSGSTGASTGPHLHYEERFKGKSHRPTFRPDLYRPRRDR